ncbi:hypothetical protein [Cytobacillus horneckiae]|uniref:hypothetical protein n=1 Tax=Cytobacillus horneckiae TaxID=549687 RepID=UPI003D9A5CE8
MGKSTVLFVSRPLKAAAVKELTNKVKELFIAGHEKEANILLLRNASRKSENLSRKEAE